LFNRELRSIGKQAKGRNLLTGKHTQVEIGYPRTGQRIDFAVIVCKEKFLDNTTRPEDGEHSRVHRRGNLNGQVSKLDNLGNYMTGTV
jgi:hypothetical protein